jgi:hypothetical protein
VDTVSDEGNELPPIYETCPWCEQIVDVASGEYCRCDYEEEEERAVPSGIVSQLLRRALWLTRGG